MTESAKPKTYVDLSAAQLIEEALIRGEGVFADTGAIRNKSAVVPKVTWLSQLPLVAW